jgi:hypothetical protein
MRHLTTRELEWLGFLVLLSVYFAAGIARPRWFRVMRPIRPPSDEDTRGGAILGLVVMVIFLLQFVLSHR